MFDEPRYVIKNVCNHFYDMPANTIREQTFCCGSGAGLNAGEDMELRLTGGLPRANAVKYVHEKHGVNMLSTICAIDRAALPALMEYWVPEVDVAGVHELVANALNLDGQNDRTTDLRGEDIPGLAGAARPDIDSQSQSRKSVCAIHRVHEGRTHATTGCLARLCGAKR